MTKNDSLINNVGNNIKEKSAMIWNIADVLRGPFKPHEYGLIILPFTIIKRFHDCLLPNHQKIIDIWEKVKKMAVVEGFLTQASGYQFYNTSKFTFSSLLNDSENIETNFRDYVTGFSENVQDILAKFNFDNIITRLVEANCLYLVIKEFNTDKGYLGPDKIKAVDCGYIFEDLVSRFSESYDEHAGEHFTSRDIVYLMTDILLNDSKIATTKSCTVYDMAMGTSQMLSCMQERIATLNKDTKVVTFGQEINPSTFGIAKADMMIRGGDPNNMRYGDTLSDDQFKGFTFDYIISNPPFGLKWNKEEDAVKKEHALGDAGRFAPGLPKITDGQQLFVLNGLSKLNQDGKMAIIQDGSPLFTGDAESGPSEIRRYILENDWLDCIIQLNTDMFMNTPLGTYIWVLNKNRPNYKVGKVLLIDATKCFVKRIKPIGKKRNDITDECRNMIIKAYSAYKSEKYTNKNLVVECKLFETTDFGYNKITVERPQRDEKNEIITDKKGKPIADKNLEEYEYIPMNQDIDAYFNEEVLPFASDAWYNPKKTKVGYEIPMTRYFYKYQIPEDENIIFERVQKLEEELDVAIKSFLGEKR